MVRKFFMWVFKNELCELKTQITKAKEVTLNCESQEKRVKNVLQNIDIGVGIEEHQHSPSWAVISLQGQKTDYIKFINLRDSDLRDIERFLRRYERNAVIKIDANPKASGFLRIPTRG